MRTSADDSRDNDDDESNTDVLTLHATHVFVFTSAGRPLYTYRGDDNALASFMAMLRVLMSMSAAVVNAPPLPRPAAAAEQLQQQHDTTAASTPSARMTLRRVRCADARLAVHFCSEGELCYVLATRNAHSSSSSSSSNSDDAWCDALLRAVRHYVRGVVPTVDAILTQTPSYDVRSLFTRADGSVLTALIDSYTHDEDNNNNKDSVHVMRGAPLHAVAILPLRAAQRRWLQTHVLQQQQACTSSSSSGGGGGNGAYDEHHVYSCLCLRGRVLAAVAHHNNNNNTTCLSASDIQLLLHFAVVLCRRQAGEAWAPLCLPDYNASGYVWVYCSTLAALTTTTTAAAAPGAAASASHSIAEAVLVHVSASEHCFLHYSQYAHDAARRVLASAPLCCDVAYAHTAVADDDDDGGDNSPDASAAHRLLAWLQVNAVSRAVSHNATLLSSSSSTISHDVVSLVNVCCEAVCWVGAVTYSRATRATSGNEGDGSAAAAAAARRLCLLHSSDGALRTLLSGGGGNRRCAAAAAAAFYARIATLHARLDAQPMPLLLLLSSTAASDVTVTCDGNSNSDSKKENKHDDATAAPLAPSLVLLRPTRAVLERLRCECSAAHDGSERATTTAAAAAAAMQLPPLSLWSSRCQARVHELIVALAPRTTQSHTCMLSAAYSVLYLLATQPDACDIAVSL